MAIKKTAVKTISDKLVKINDSFTVNMYDNGYMMEIGGENHDGDWKDAKIMCNTLEDLIALIQEAGEMERR